jgi:hypothetical protein
VCATGMFDVGQSKDPAPTMFTMRSRCRREKARITDTLDSRPQPKTAPWAKGFPRGALGFVCSYSNPGLEGEGAIGSCHFWFKRGPP